MKTDYTHLGYRGTHYACEGDVRGSCGHRHHNYATALRCLESDRVGCHRQGGYSDRLIICYRDGVETEVDEDGAPIIPV